MTILLKKGQSMIHYSDTQGIHHFDTFESFEMAVEAAIYYHEAKGHQIILVEYADIRFTTMAEVYSWRKIFRDRAKEEQRIFICFVFSGEDHFIMSYVARGFTKREASGMYEYVFRGAPNIRCYACGIEETLALLEADRRIAHFFSREVMELITEAYEKSKTNRARDAIIGRWSRK